MMPLEHKIPMIPGPKGAYSFTRRKVGKKLWGPKLEFNLSDPYCHETKFPYEPLHDEHLVEFFSRPINLKCLLKADLITDDMDVKCSLRDYNDYRKYLRQVHADRIKREMRRRDRLFVERAALRFAEDQARKEVERLIEREKWASERQRLVQQRLLQEKVRNQKLKERAYRSIRRLKLLRLVRQEERRLINIKREERTELSRQKCKLATEIARSKVIDTLVDWKKKGKTQKKAKEKLLLDIEQRKQKEMEERWKKKQQFQENDIAKQKILLERVETHRQKFIEDYNKKINKETAKMKELLDNAKLFTRCYMKRYLPGGRTLICCKKYFKSDLEGHTKMK
ncbi:PREDICTED: fibrous sheath-interacting protein 2 isoform X2 [Vollenhovia emeryi]|nr:PREDICTED: fibrous sheath-interacting protein 2 isoform X2 [Vollenhovia emeryi]XP_011872215.1 PREDICTED: fibrous sheath-interacting protein 2 isoform X2 [Vollenhovia emeryi]